MIRATGLRRMFGSFVAVDDVSLIVPDGSILALLGPNGAGKTTTVRMLAGLLAPTEGEVEVAGWDVSRKPAEVRARVGLVTDVPGLFAIGLRFQYRRTSTFVDGARHDAAYLAERVAVGVALSQRSAARLRPPGFGKGRPSGCR